MALYTSCRARPNPPPGGIQTALDDRDGPPSRACHTSGMPYRLDLAALTRGELRRVLPPGQAAVAIPALRFARLLRRRVLASDIYPDRIELRIADEEEWEALQPSAAAAQGARSFRNELADLGFKQVGAFTTRGLPWGRNFFAYAKERDTFASIWLADRDGPEAYVDLFSLFRAPRNGATALLTTNQEQPDPLDPSPSLWRQRFPNSSVAALYLSHRSAMLTAGVAGRRAERVEDFAAAFLDLWNDTYQSWVARGLLKAAS